MTVGAIGEILQAILLAIGVIVFVLVKSAQRRPDVGWLQPFRFTDHRTEEQKRRARRSGNIMAGVQLILLGIAIVPGYFILSMMMFMSEVSSLELWIAGAISILMVGAGITAIVHSSSM